MPLSGSSSELRGTYGAGDPGNGRFRSRAFQRALLHSERITDEKVTALQRQRDFRIFMKISQSRYTIYKEKAEILKMCSIVLTSLCIFFRIQKTVPRSRQFAGIIFIYFDVRKKKNFLFFLCFGRFFHRFCIPPPQNQLSFRS